jgi:hypothetical protein
MQYHRVHVLSGEIDQHVFVGYTGKQAQFKCACYDLQFLLKIEEAVQSLEVEVINKLLRQNTRLKLRPLGTNHVPQKVKCKMTLSLQCRRRS